MRIINANKIDIFDLSVVRVAHTFISTPFAHCKSWFLDLTFLASIRLQFSTLFQGCTHLSQTSGGSCYSGHQEQKSIHLNDNCTAH